MGADGHLTPPLSADRTGTIPARTDPNLVVSESRCQSEADSDARCPGGVLGTLAGRIEDIRPTSSFAVQCDMAAGLKGIVT